MEIKQVKQTMLSIRIPFRTQKWKLKRLCSENFFVFPYKEKVQQRTTAMDEFTWYVNFRKKKQKKDFPNGPAREMNRVSLLKQSEKQTEKGHLQRSSQ